MAKGVVDGLQIASEVDRVELENELPLTERNNGGRLGRILVIVEKRREGIWVLIICEEVGCFLEDLRGLVFRPSDSGSVGDAGVRIAKLIAN